MKHLFIINPSAGGIKGRVSEMETEIRAFTETLSEPYEIYMTQGPMDACSKIAKEADYADMLYVYACGGDGTLNECANGAAMRANVAITHYPRGTGNDFIRMFGKDNEHLFHDLNALANGTVRRLDLINCDGRYGLDICSVGIDARIGNDVHKYSGIPLIGGVTGYVVSLIVNIIKGVTQHFRITAGDFSIDDKITLACACNGRYYGGGFNPVPDAMPDDGYLDFLVVKAVSRIKIISVVLKYAKGQYYKFPSIITRIRGNEMEIEADQEFTVNIDGESIRARTMSFKLVPGGVNFIFPSELSFFDSIT